MRTLLACSALLLLPLAARASDAPCRYTEARQLALDTRDIKTVVLEVNQHDLRVTARPGAASLAGRACASNAGWLPQLALTQQRAGDTLTVSLRRNGGNGYTTGQDYAWLDISGSIPESVLVQLKVGSGDAEITGAKALSVDLGSGDVTARGTSGSIHAAVGSGDLQIDGAETLRLLALGSGDVDAAAIRRDVSVGRIGSGDLALRDIGGNLQVDTLGSGEVKARTVRGNATVGVAGSGDIELTAISGNVSVGTHGSGDVRAEDVGGDLTVTRSGSGSVRHRDVRGTVSVPRGK